MKYAKYLVQIKGLQWNPSLLLTEFTQPVISYLVSYVSEPFRKTNIISALQQNKWPNISNIYFLSFFSFVKD